MKEYALTIDFAEQPLLAIVHPSCQQVASSNRQVGVLIVVGGPQYRVGSHRQFVQLARALAKANITTMRFDYRGMGDSGCDKVEFDDVNQDIRAAIDAFLQAQPELNQVVIWGLCDAASAALMYSHQDDRVAAMVIANPWLKNQQAMAKTMARHYYLQRLLSKSFWLKLFRGQVNVLASARETKGYLADSLSSTELSQQSYQYRMQYGLEHFTGRVCLILSGNDLTAKEFEQQAMNSNAWQKLMLASNQVHHLPQADHTFSSSHWKQEVVTITKNFINDIGN